jgi:hypothetical protein
MPIRKSTIIGDTLNKMAAPLVRHLTILECGKWALAEAAKAEETCQTEASCGASDAAEAILGLLGDPEPIELARMGRLEGVRLKRKLFCPLRGVSMTPLQEAVYRAGLWTAEIQMRRLHDSNELHPDVYRG